MITVYMARLDTANFEFHAFGTSEAGAREVLRRAWARHRKATGAEWEWDDIEDGVSVVPVVVGKAYRDLSEV